MDHNSVLLSERVKIFAIPINDPRRGQAFVIGVKGGGGAKLTPTGEKVIQLYRKMEKKADTATQTEWKTLQKLLHPENLRG